MTVPSIINIPGTLLKATKTKFYIDYRSQGSQENNSGGEVVLQNAPPIWRGSITFSATGRDIDQWMALRDELQGRLNAARIPMLDARKMPNDLNNYFGSAPVVDAPQPGEGTFEIEHGTVPYTPFVGQLVSIDDNPYRLLGVLQLTSTTTRLRVSPKLRAEPQNGVVDFLPYGLFKLVADDTGTFDTTYTDHNLITFAFEEYWPRA